MIPYEPPRLNSDDKKYQDSLLKLISFRLHHNIPSLKKILVLDADQLILQSLDHVFSLPEVDLAAPRAYWLPSTFTLAFLLISLSDRLWKQVERGLHTIERDDKDMDLANKLFNKTALILPGSYTALNSHWEINWIPNWWQGVEPAKRKDWKPRPAPPRNDAALRADAPVDQNGKAHGGANPQSAKELDELWEAEKKEQLEEDMLQERQARLEEAVNDVFKDAKVIHSTAYGKPWEATMGRLKADRPYAHPLFRQQFGEWRKAAQELCVGIERIVP